MQNRIATGFQLASLYWVFENEAEIYEKIDQVMFPKDYVKYRLTGRIVTDYSDAAGGMAFDNVNMCWSKPLIEGIGLTIDIFPEYLPSIEVIGQISQAAATDTGLATTTKVVNGGSDQCMQSIGNGLINDGIFSSNIGTGGQIAASASRPDIDPQMRISTFAHVIPQKWNLMGASLSCGNALRWFWKDVIACEDYDVLNKGCEAIPPGAEGLIFSPYLAGERTPHMNPEAKGMFCGLTLKHKRFHMARAVMEGVTFALKDCLNVLLEMGPNCNKIIAAGGGAKSKIWLQMQADIFERNIYTSNVDEQAALGAALVAGIGVGVYQTFEEACSRFVTYDQNYFSPIPAHVSVYQEYYELFKELYQANNKIFNKLDRVGRA